MFKSCSSYTHNIVGAHASELKYTQYYSSKMAVHVDLCTKLHMHSVIQFLAPETDKPDDNYSKMKDVHIGKRLSENFTCEWVQSLKSAYRSKMMPCTHAKHIIPSLLTILRKKNTLFGKITK